SRRVPRLPGGGLALPGAGAGPLGLGPGGAGIRRPPGLAGRPVIPAAASRCLNCGLCALVGRRVGRVRTSDLASAYLRGATALSDAASDVGGGDPGSAALAAATAACPVGVPVDEVAAVVRRLAGS